MYQHFVPSDDYIERYGVEEYQHFLPSDDYIELYGVEDDLRQKEENGESSRQLFQKGRVMIHP